MGSFANGLQIAGKEGLEIIGAIEGALGESGFVAIDGEYATDAGLECPATCRAFWVFKSQNGWVGVLDSDLSGSGALASEISGRLKTCALQFSVHDSDSWCFRLFQDGSGLDEFDSSGGLSAGFGTSGIPSEMVAAALSGDFEVLAEKQKARMEEMAKEVEKAKGRMEGMLQEMEDAMPAEIRRFKERVASGTATPEELKKYADWAMGQSKKIASSAVADSNFSNTRAGIPDEMLNRHLENLRPILPEDTDDDRILEVLGSRSTFAEEDLSSFLDLVGIAPEFANLSSEYIEEFDEADLAQAGIFLDTQLVFKIAAAASGI